MKYPQQVNKSLRRVRFKGMYLRRGLALGFLVSPGRVKEGERRRSRDAHAPLRCVGVGFLGYRAVSRPRVKEGERRRSRYEGARPTARESCAIGRGGVQCSLPALLPSIRTKHPCVRTRRRSLHDDRVPGFGPAPRHGLGFATCLRSFRISGSGRLVCGRRRLRMWLGLPLHLHRR